MLEIVQNLALAVLYYNIPIGFAGVTKPLASAGDIGVEGLFSSSTSLSHSASSSDEENMSCGKGAFFFVILNN